MRTLAAAVSRRSWAAGLLALALLPAGVVQIGCSRVAVSVEPKTALATDLAGRWSGRLQGGELQLQMKMSDAPLSNWELVSSYPVSQLQGFSTRPAARFELRRDSGTFRFQGRFKDGNGNGTVTFHPDSRFAQQLGVPIPAFGLLELAANDVSLDYAREMKDLGLVAYRRQRPNPLQGLWGDLMGRREPPVQRLIELRSQGITPAFVRDVRAAVPGDLKPRDLIELHRQGVNAAFIREAQSQSRRTLTISEILALRARGASS